MASIALEHGFENFETIWNAPENATLRQFRESPFTLLPDDEVFIPDKVAHEDTRPTNAEHLFVVHRRRLTVRMRLLDVFGEPLDSVACVVTIDGGEPASLTTGSDGQLEVPITPRARRGVATAEGGARFAFDIGCLDPLPEPTSIAGRLHNLGYPAGDPRRRDLDTDEWTRFGAELYRRDTGQPEVADIDPGFVQQLAEDHGC